MTPIRLPVPHIEQSEPGECLAACAAMVLRYMDFPVNYRRLVELLHIEQGFGTAFFHIQELERLGLVVIYKEGTLEEIHEHLTYNRPCLVPVKTRELPHWSEDTDHAVVVVGMDDEQVYLNDPVLPTAPTKVPLAVFDLARLERDEIFAAIKRQE